MEKITIELHEVIHKNYRRLLIKFVYDIAIEKKIKSLSGIKWSATYKAWHIANDSFVKDKLMQLFNDEYNIEIYIDSGDSADDISETDNNGIRILNVKAREKVEKFISWLRFRRYSENTIETYSDAIRIFLKFYNSKDIMEITNDDIIFFNDEHIVKNKFSASYQNQVINAIKLFFLKIENTKIDLKLIHRPKRPKLLPNVLSKEEIKKILEMPSNIKHRAMLSLVYSCGLRRSELLNLKIENIDSKRNLLIIKQAKGRKDRIVPLSNKIIEILREYYKSFRPKIFLFEGQGGEMYGARSLANVLEHAVKKAGIRKPVSLHWLRHSYATHLLENGTDLRFIQEILGHSSSRTTEIYTHVSTKSIQNIKSPFDDL